MVFTKYVEIGRVAYVPSKKTIFTIVDVVDKNHVIVDSPTKDSRMKINMNNIQLTKFKLEFLFGARSATVIKACNSLEILINKNVKNICYGLELGARCPGEVDSFRCLNHPGGWELVSSIFERFCIFLAIRTYWSQILQSAYLGESSRISSRI